MASPKHIFRAAARMHKAKDRVRYLDHLRTRLDQLEFDDKVALKPILTESETFIVRVFGEGSQYYARYRDLELVPIGIIYNTGHYKLRETWDTAASQLRSILDGMRLELATYGNPVQSDGAGLQVEQVTIPWLVQHVSWTVWVSFFSLLAAAFAGGVVLGQTKFVKELFGL